MIKVKNNKEEAGSWCGMLIQPDEYYEIDKTELSKWQNNSQVLVDISNGNLIINNGTSDILDVALAINLLKEVVLEVDDQGRQVNRIAAAKKGWTYLAHSIEVETSKLGSLYCKDYLGNDVSGLTLKFFNSSNVELTTQEDIDTSCVRTELLIKPSYDYEIMGGNIHHSSVPTSDVRLWVIGGLIEAGGPYVKEMVRGVNLKFLGTDDHIETDGRASKYMKKDTAGVPYQTNQLKMIVKHDAGFKHNIMLVLEYFRE